jgi:hypothetical protein
MEWKPMVFSGIMTWDMSRQCTRDKALLEDMKIKISLGRGVKALIRFESAFKASFCRRDRSMLHLFLENTKEALVPPNPKLLDMEILTSFC